MRSKAGKVTDIWLAGANVKPEKVLAREMERQFGSKRRAKN
jgi:hypothetical protein